MKETPRQSFRWAAHTSGAASVRPRDYEDAGELDAPSVYAAWSALLGTERPLAIGDLLEEPDGTLRICKYVGFEEARWIVPEASSGVPPVDVAAANGSAGS